MKSLQIYGAIRETLPQPALELYRAAFNRVCETQSTAEAVAQGEFSAEAHEAALRAVQEKFSQDKNGNWKPGPAGDHMQRQAKNSESSEAN